MATSRPPLAEVLREAEISQAELGRLIRSNREGLEASDAYLSRIVGQGMRPGIQYRSAITRALAKKGIDYSWD